MAERLCLSCRERQFQDHRLPLGIEPGGSLILSWDRPRAWICMRRKCIDKLRANPHRAKRRFKCQVEVTEAWVKQAESHHMARQKTLLLRAHREGLLALGPSKTIQVADNLAAILLAANRSSHIQAQFSARIYQGKTFTFPLSSTQIGDLLARGPRSVVGIRPGRTTQSLLDGLRMWHGLG